MFSLSAEFHFNIEIKVHFQCSQKGLAKLFIYVYPVFILIKNVSRRM